ncbi:sensor domain-containing phosphodiesterase [Oceanobacillus manasiensis]|uniref:sensor domain-containing phosphodiesterase n=1 Tax=Oceanobacillus manasiensis TaxID=586413 RepID=UPI000694EBF2|nr:EAL domain-containing protein [Oceanobacillus manasiensis]
MTSFDKKDSLGNLFSIPPNPESYNKANANVKQELLNYYASLAMHHPDLIIAFSPQGEILSQNKENIGKFLGITCVDKVNLKDLIPDSYKKNLYHAFNQALLGHSERHEIVIEGKSKKEKIHACLTFVPISGSDKIDGVYIIIEDTSEIKELAEELKKHKTHLIAAQKVASVGSWEYIIPEQELFCSPSFYEIFGLGNNEKITMKKLLQHYIHPDDREKTRSMFHKALNEGKSYKVECRIHQQKIEDKLRYLKVQAELMWKDNVPWKLTGVVMDYTEEKNLEIELRHTLNSMVHMFNNLDAGIWMKEFDTKKITLASEQLVDLLHIPLKKIYDDPTIWEQLVHPDFQEKAFEKQKQLLEGKPIKHKYKIVCGDNSIKWIHDQTLPWINDEGKITHLFGVMLDITEEKKMQDHLRYISTHDEITGLPNQQSLHETVDKLIKDENPFAILHLDLDRFNVINHSLGYQVGDMVIQQLAERLQKFIPSTGYLARLNNSDFVMILQHYNGKEEVFDLAQQTIQSIGKALMIKDYELHVTTSVGISFYPEDGTSKLRLLENAYSALYHAKQQGSNNFQFYSFSRDISSYKKFLLEKDMRRAIVNEEFELYYQPKVEATTGQLKGAEALIRWNHPNWGMVSPNEFIPLAEENHLIHHISDWVIRKTCDQLWHWRNAGYPVMPISINLSPLRLLKRGLVELIKGQLTLYKLPASMLEIEITESSLLKNDISVLKTLEELRNLGIKIAIDDFGTGYASLNYLHEFEADIIKIDQIFIQNITSANKKDAAIVSAVMHLAKEIGMCIVAEGVEEKEQYDFLKERNCDLIQGYYFSKPVPLSEFESMLQNGYLLPKESQKPSMPLNDRRGYPRYQFNHWLKGKLIISKYNKQKIELGSARMLIKDIGLRGIQIVTSVSLPVPSDIAFEFSFTILEETYSLIGSPVWQQETKKSYFIYGIQFHAGEEKKLHALIEKLTMLKSNKEALPETDFFTGDPSTYLGNSQV